MPRSEPPSHDAGLACPQLSAAATDDDVGRLATTMLDRLARPPLGQGTATFSSPDVDLTQSAFEGRPRHIATVGQPRLPRQGSLLKSCSRTLATASGGAIPRQNKPARTPPARGQTRRVARPALRGRLVWPASQPPAGRAAGGHLLLRTLCPVVPLLVPRQEAVAQKAQIVASEGRDQSCNHQ